MNKNNKALKLEPNHKSRALLSSAIILGLTFTTAPAISAEDNISQIPDISVKAGTDQGQRTDTATIVTQEDLEEKRTAVAFDALENLPGLNVVRRLGMTGSGLSRLTIRGNGGVGPAGIQVYVDGRPDATVSFAHPTPSALGIAEVEYIEVIHGPSPVLHGSGKTGVVNIVTANPEPGLHSFLDLSYGRFNTFENFAGASYGGDNGYARLSFSHRGTDGSNPDSDAEVKSFNFKGGYDINEIFDVTFTAAKNEDEFEVFNQFFVPGPFTDPRTTTLDLTQTVFDFTINADFGNVVSSLKFFHDDLDPVSQVLDAGTPPQTPEERADVSEEGLRFKTIWAASKQTNVTVGVDYLKAQADNSPVLPPFGGPMLTNPVPRVHEELDETSVYAFVDHALSNSVSISGGVRGTDHSEYGSVNSSELGVQFRPETNSSDDLLHATTFRARATRGYQSPTLQQLFGVFRGGRGGPANPDLGPEIIEQFEIGFNKTFAKGDFDIVIYTQKGEDLIEFPTTPPPPPSDIQNSIDYSNNGIEVTLHYLLTENINTMLGITIADFDHDTGRFLRVPEKTLDMGITYTKNRLSASLFGRYASGAEDVAPPVSQFPPTTPSGPQVELDSYFVADLRLNYVVNKNVRAFFGIENITDEEYELVTGIPATPISAYAGVSLRY